MVNTSQVTKTKHAVPLIAAVVLFAIFGMGYFVVGFDQGQIFSIFEGQSAYAQMNGVGLMHEYTHD
ncbi:MAG: CbtB domain-containing protein, partial [Nitrosotalea sp.]